MVKRYQSCREEAMGLRSQGLTYAEIAERLSLKIPKSTLSYWLGGMAMDDRYRKKVELLAYNNLVGARLIAAELKKSQTSLKQKRLNDLNRDLFSSFFDNPAFNKVLLAGLYWAEGGKNRSDIMFGNSDPEMVRTFLVLLRKCYPIDESKFRVTVQCRADSDISLLEDFWSKTTGIGRDLFYKAQIDWRTAGKPTSKTDYKGVCRIVYFSADIFQDIIQAIKVLSEGMA